MEISTGLQSTVVSHNHGSLSTDEVSMDHSKEPSTGVPKYSLQIPETVILKATNKSLPVGSDSGSGGQISAEDIENCPMHCPSPVVSGKAVEGLRKEPRAKMTLSPNKAAAEAIAASAFVLKHSTVPKTLNSSNSHDGLYMGDLLDLAVSRSDSVVAKQRSKSSRASSVESDTKNKHDSASVKSESSVSSLSSHSASTAPGIRKARKSLPLGTSSRKSVDRNLSEASKSLPIANMTLQLSEIEKTLGIKTLSNIDAKTLDKLILEKARMPRRDSGNRSQTASPDIVRVDFPITEDLLPHKNSASESKRNNSLSNKHQPSLEKVQSSPQKVVLSTSSESDMVNDDVVLEAQDVDTKKVSYTDNQTKPVSVNVDANCDVELGVAIHSTVQAKQTKLSQKRKRKRRSGNYDLPSNKKKYVPKKTVQYTRSSEKKTVNATPSRRAVVAAASPRTLDDSYETVNEMEVSQAEEPAVQLVSQDPVVPKTSCADLPAGIPNISAAAATSTPVLQKVCNTLGVLQQPSKEASATVSSPIKTGQSKPVLGLKKAPVLSDSSKQSNNELSSSPLVKPKAKKSKSTPNKCGTAGNTDDSEVVSPSSMEINPKTGKPYVRGPYKKKTSAESSPSACSSTCNEVSDFDRSHSESGSPQKLVSPVLKKPSKKLAKGKNIVAAAKNGNASMPVSKGFSQKHPHGSVAKATLKGAKPGKLSKKRSEKAGLVVAMAGFFNKKKTKALPMKAGVKSSTTTSTKAAIPQRSVLDMFMELKKHRGSTPSEAELPSADVPKPQSETLQKLDPSTVLTTETELSTPLEAESEIVPEAAAEPVPETEIEVASTGKLELKLQVEPPTESQTRHPDVEQEEDNDVMFMEAPEPETTSNAATQVEQEQVCDAMMTLEHTDPEFLPLEDPVLMDLPSLRKSPQLPTTLAELKATLDAEAEQQQPQHKRKRKGICDNTSPDESDARPNWQAKRAKRSVQENSLEMENSLEIESLGVSPLYSPGREQLLQPTATTESETIDLTTTSKHPAAAAMVATAKSKAGTKYVNTPNGVQYPVTPPKTPEESTGSAGTQEKVNPQLVSPLAQERNFLPLCCCRINGTLFHSDASTLYCQALDSIDGRVVGCANKVTVPQLVRPAVKIPFMAICEVHRKRHKLHHCCPGCGHFCTQGIFLQCKKGCTTAVHHYHRECQVYKDSKYYCPHCGEESAQYEVVLSLYEPRSAAHFSKPKSKRSNVSQARMGSSNRPTRSADEVSEVDVDDEITFRLPTGKELKSHGPKWGPSRIELANAISYLKGEKPKKLRTGPKSLYYGVKAYDVERVMFQLAEGCDPNFKNEDQNNQTAVHAAAYLGNPAIMHLLVQAGGDIQATDDDLQTPLMVAAERGHLDTAAYLLRSGAIATARREDGLTPLHLAAKNGHRRLCEYILSNTDVDINTTDDGGWTPLIWAAEHNNLETVKFLLAGGSNPNIRDNEQNTALHWAVFAGSVDIAEMFLSAGCDMECPNEHGDRALHIAARQGHYECIVLLLARGADSLCRNNDNETPMHACGEEDSAVWLALKVNRELKGFAAKCHQQPPKLLHRDISMGREANPIPVVNDIDNENYPRDFHYVHENIETSPMTVNRVLTSLQNCQCKDDCSSIFCMCGRNSVRCWYDKDGLLVPDFNQVEPPLVFECNKACKCWATCRNRVVQLGITTRLQVFRTNGRGWGLRTNLNIKQGTFVCEYVGEHISDAEADAREDDSYLFDLDNKDSDTFCIDARYYANVARFINHLCQPNLIPVKVFVEHQDLRFPRICFFASRDINAGEELGFDYGEKFWIIKWKQFTCACKSPTCKYSSETIQRTIAEYNRRQQEDEATDDV